MKKIVLVAVNAKYIHSNLAIYSLKKYAEQFVQSGQVTIEIAEYTINQYIPEMIQDLFQKRPDVLAFSCYIWNREYVGKMIQDFRKIMPTLPIWVGGPEAFYDAEGFLQEYSGTTGVMIGEGEEIFKNLVLYYQQESKFDCDSSENQICVSDVVNENVSNLSDIRGLVYRDENGRIVRNQREALLDLNDIPFPYDSIDQLQNKILYYESSRGCPFSCSYCLSSVEKQLRFRDVERVKEELAIFLKHQVPQVKFVDRTFNCNKKHAMEIWKFILEHNNGITNFHFEIAADLIDEEALELLSQMPAGIIQFEIGVQSTNQDTIEEIDRSMDLEKVRYVVERIQSFGTIHQHLDLIAGLPYEDYQQFQTSFNDVYAMKPEQLQLGFLKVLKGANMEQKAKGYALEYSEYPPYEVLSTKWISYEELLALKRVENVVEIYYNSSQFTNSIAYIERYFTNAFEMYACLGAFYDQHFQVGEKHSRISRYTLLLSFIKSYLTDTKRYTGSELETELEICRELLTYDVYLRENIKTRPEFCFAVDAEKYRNFYRQYKKEGKQMHIEHFQYDVWSFSEGVQKRLQEVLSADIQKQEQDILFDYQKRFVIGHAARTERIQIQDEETNEKGCS